MTVFKISGLNGYQIQGRQSVVTNADTALEAVEAILGDTWMPYDGHFIGVEYEQVYLWNTYGVGEIDADSDMLASIIEIEEP